MTSVTVIDLPRAFVSTVVFGISTLASTGTVTVVVGLREVTTVVCDVDNNNAFGRLDVMALLTVADLPEAFLSTVVCDSSTLVAGTDTVTVVVGLQEAATVVCDVECVFTFDDDDCCCTIDVDALVVIGNVITPFGSRIRSTCSLFRFMTRPCSSKMILK